SAKNASTSAARSLPTAFTSFVVETVFGNCFQDGVSIMNPYQISQPVVEMNSRKRKAASGCCAPLGIAHQFGQNDVIDLLPLGPYGSFATSQAKGISASVTAQLPDGSMAAFFWLKALSG